MPGLKVGADAVARISPLLGFIATIAPPFASQWLSRMREADAVLERPLGRPLERDVDRQLHRCAGHRLRRHHRRLVDLRADRVDALELLARAAAEVLVVGLLDARLADTVAGARHVQLLRARERAASVVLLDVGQLGGRELAHVAEHVREERLRVVPPQVGDARVDSRELGLVLAQIRDLLLVDRDLHRHGRERVRLPLLELAQELRQRDVQHLRERLHLGVAALLRQVDRRDLDGRAGDVRDERASHAVEDRAALRLDRERPDLVVERRLLVLRAREDLQRPEPQEEHREDDERDRREDRDAQRHPRREEVRLLDPRVAREEALGPVARC